ncbi:hypothetical protein AMECASPLE_024938 [Ameca splendens]|uniref:Uncharacterized protein n=1 Tax=Ameca splendens TaxID=208324 RepID=A0ABV1AAT4_9TELE
MLPLPLSAGDGSVQQAGVVLLQDVFAVKVKRRRAVGQQSGGAVLGLALFHCRRRGRRLEEDALHLHNASAEHTHSWYNTLKELLTGKHSQSLCCSADIKPIFQPEVRTLSCTMVSREHLVSRALFCAICCVRQLQNAVQKLKGIQSYKR